MRSAQKFQRKDETIESLKLKGETSVDESLLGALVDQESGILKAGLLPQLDAASSSGSKELLNRITQAWVWEIMFHFSSVTVTIFV